MVLARGGFRPGAGAKKGSKFSPRGQTTVRKIKAVSKFIRVLKKLCKIKEASLLREAGRTWQCEWCGKPWESEIRRGPKKYCSDGCRVQLRQKLSESHSVWQDKTCAECGKVFRTRNDSRYCSGECWGTVCSRERRAERPIYHCKKCGKEFYRQKRPEATFIYCSRECAGNGEVGKAKTPRNWMAGNYRKRAKVNGVEYQTIDVMAVLERDGWRCQMCGKDTPRKYRGTTRHNAPEIDHQVPISRGGGHTWDNVQCACRGCNAKKSNKSSAGQLRLFC